MPKKKSGQRKKAEKQKERQKQLIRAPKTDIGKAPGNAEMICDQCNKRQKNRAFCYFCQSLQRLPMCAHCGRTKCMQAGGDCLVKHMGTFATGITLVGAICDFCEAWVCHSRRCLQKHSCPCPLDGALCAECNRSIPEHGGRMFKCSFCNKWLCEDDQFEHQASCQTLDTDTYKCISCNKMGGWVCLKCKISFCDLHVQSATTKFAKKEKEIDCKKCHQPLKDISNLSVSVRKLDFGRQTYESTHQGGDEDDDGEGQGTATFSFGGRTVSVQRQQYSDDEDEDEDQVMHKFGNLSTYNNEGYDYEYDEEDDEDDEDDEEDDEDDEDDDEEDDEDENNTNNQ